MLPRKKLKRERIKGFIKKPRKNLAPKRNARFFHVEFGNFNKDESG